MEYKLSGVWEEFCEAVVEAMSLRETGAEYIVDENEVHNKKDKGYKYLLSIKKNFIDFVKRFMKISWNKEIGEEFKRWLVNVFIIDEEKQEIIEKKFVKEESEMSNLAQIGREIYEDG